jgi:nitroreductase
MHDCQPGERVSLTPDQLLTTTRAVRRRLDLSRPVPRALIDECVEIAAQAPSPGNRQDARFVVVGDEVTKMGLAEIYRAGYPPEGILRRQRQLDSGAPLQAIDRAALTETERINRSADFLFDHIHEVPWLVIPCALGRERPGLNNTLLYSSVLPAVWSFMLAARIRGLGTCWTTVHTNRERDAADLLGIPYDEYTQVAMIPVAFHTGVGFQPGPRRPASDLVHWERW